MPPTQHPAYRGLFDYDALKARSNANYDAQDASLRHAPDYGGYNNTMNIMGNQQNKQSTWAPYFQALQDQGVSRVGQDVMRPHGIADYPSWGQEAMAPLAAMSDQIPRQPLMDSNNIATPPTLGLRRAGRK